MNLEESPFSTKDGDFLDNKYKKEGWQSFVVLAVMLLVFGSYMLSESAPAYQNVLQLVVILLVGYLLWRVETLSDLSISQQQSLSQ